RLALMEEFKSMPFAAVWDKLCSTAGVPVGADWLADMEKYEQEVLSARN
ncbi:MAG: L-rhamnose isomerase, partial [Verrucomicrobia bacterium]|nr:L-rhamnose isomerase [Verrucomicrobiota bacterium]